jgi:hypothetical protein
MKLGSTTFWDKRFSGKNTKESMGKTLNDSTFRSSALAYTLSIFVKAMLFLSLNLVSLSSAQDTISYTELSATLSGYGFQEFSLPSLSSNDTVFYFKYIDTVSTDPVLASEFLWLQVASNIWVSWMYGLDSGSLYNTEFWDVDTIATIDTVYQVDPATLDTIGFYQTLHLNIDSVYVVLTRQYTVMKKYQIIHIFENLWSSANWK